jgi:hypothetical protein
MMSGVVCDHLNPGVKPIWPPVLFRLPTPTIGLLHTTIILILVLLALIGLQMTFDVQAIIRCLLLFITVYVVIILL